MKKLYLAIWAMCISLHGSANSNFPKINVYLVYNQKIKQGPSIFVLINKFKDSALMPPGSIEYSILPLGLGNS